MATREGLTRISPELDIVGSVRKKMGPNSRSAPVDGGWYESALEGGKKKKE